MGRPLHQWPRVARCALSLVTLIAAAACRDRPPVQTAVQTAEPIAATAASSDRAAPAPDAVSGTVRDPEGHGVAGAQVAVMTSLSTWFAKGGVARVVRADARGRFALSGLEPGVYHITASAPGWASTPGPKVPIDGASAPAPLALQLKRGGFEVKGRVLDERGMPLAHARIDALEAWPDDAIPSHVATSDETGRFTLQLLGPTPYLLVASTPDRYRAFQRIDPRAQTIDLTLARPATGRPDDEVLRAWLEQRALPLSGADPDASLADLEALREPIGSAHVVALGEATHGSSELFRLKHRLVRLLVEKMGFTTIAFEVGYAEALAVDAYVHGGQGDARTVVRGLVTDPFATEEVVALVEWMRRYNQHHPRKLSFVGVDITSWSSAKAVTRYLAEAGLPDQDANAALLPLASVDADQQYAAASAEVRAKTRKAIERVIATLEARRDELSRQTGAHAYELAREHAHIVEQAERSFRDPTLRDALLAENVERLRSKAPDARIALWMHNAHVTAFPPTFEDMGRRLRAELGADYRVIGTAFGSGGLRALDARDRSAGIGNHELGSPAPDSFNAALALAGKPCFAIDLRTAPEPVHDWLSSPIPTWSIGFAFQGQDASAQPTPVALAFDIIVYIDRVSAARGL